METSTTSASKDLGRRKGLLVKIAAAIVLIGGVWAWIAAASGGDEIAQGLPVATVLRGELVVSVTEKGEIKAKKMTVIANNLHWNVIIVERIDEGSHVEIGDLIIRFECKDLLDAIDRAKLDVTAADNDYQKAKEDIGLSEKQWRLNIAKAKASLENAENSLRKFEKHEQTQQIQEAQARLTLAEQDLELAEGTLKFKERVNATAGLEDTYSISTIKAEKLNVARLKLTTSNNTAEVEKLKIYEHPRELRRLQLEVASNTLDLERVQSESTAQARLVTVNEASKKSTLDMRNRKLQDLLEQKERLVEHAEAPGVILYDSGRWWDTPDVSVGAMVNSRQRLMQIPDMSSLVVTSRVFEGVSEKVKLGMVATIRLDSRPGEVYTGKVSKIAQIASSQDRRTNPNVKVFPIEIKMDEIPAKLKPGSTAKIELILARLPDTLIAPIASVITEQELTYCWRLVNGAPVRTPIKIGQLNETHVEIASGLSQGDIVMLAPPEDADVAPVLPESEAIVDSRPPAETPVETAAKQPKPAEPGQEKVGGVENVDKTIGADSRKRPAEGGKARKRPEGGGRRGSR